MMRVFQDISLFQAAALETAEGGQRDLVVGLKETFFLKGHRWGGSGGAHSPTASLSHSSAPLMPGICTATTTATASTKPACCRGTPRYAEPGVMQAPLPRCRDKAESCRYASRSQLQMQHLAQTAPKLHELGLLLSPKKRKGKEV